MTNRVETAASEILAGFDTCRQLPPLTDSAPLSLTAGYAIAERIATKRRDRGETPVGRKIGFTNRKIWPIYNVDAPVWGWVWDTGLHDVPESGEITLPARPELRIEPEIVFGLRDAPTARMSLKDLWACIDWVSHGVELVTSVYPDWRFTAPDTAAALGMHAGLWLGPRLPAAQIDPDSLPQIALSLTGPETQLDGSGADVLGSPLLALHHLVAEIDRQANSPGIAPGEIITTGTLTDAPRIARGQTWTTRLTGTALPGLSVHLV